MGLWPLENSSELIKQVKTWTRLNLQSKWIFIKNWIICDICENTKIILKRFNMLLPFKLLPQGYTGPGNTNSRTVITT